MSTEAKTKEKIDLDPKYIIKLTVTLFATCLVVAFCLGLVNGVTLPNITAIQPGQDQRGSRQGLSRDRRGQLRRHRDRGL